MYLFSIYISLFPERIPQRITINEIIDKEKLFLENGKQIYLE